MFTPATYPLPPPYDVCVKRTTIMLPDELDARLRYLAGRRGTSVSELVREALEARYGQPAGPRALSFAGVGRAAPGTPSDLGRRHEDLLGEALWRGHEREPDADR
jgi:plasmid stability protein